MRVESISCSSISSYPIADLEDILESRSYSLKDRGDRRNPPTGGDI